MSYLEEVLYEFRNGAKIRRKIWSDNVYVSLKTHNQSCMAYADIKGDDWEIYQEPIDYDYIIKNKCLCWFWDGSGNYKQLGILIKVNENNTLCRYDCRKSNGDFYQYASCRPVRRDEVTFYEDRKDD